MKLTQSEIDALFAKYSSEDEPVSSDSAPTPEPTAAPIDPAALVAATVEAAQQELAATAAPAPAAMAAPAPITVPVAAPAAVPAASVAPAAFPTLNEAGPAPQRENSIGLLAGVELEVKVVLGRARRSIREILSLGPGSVLELDNLAGETVEIQVNGLVVGKGEVVVVGENYGVRMVELVPQAGGRSD